MKNGTSIQELAKVAFCNYSNGKKLLRPRVISRKFYAVLGTYRLYRELGNGNLLVTR
ncbi:MAG: hypothetical protein ACXAEU_08345 [Candidatus Hodarchaeales archaeon]|jgi:hypothetical protein